MLLPCTIISFCYLYVSFMTFKYVNFMRFKCIRNFSFSSFKLLKIMKIKTVFFLLGKSNAFFSLDEKEDNYN